MAMNVTNARAAISFFMILLQVGLSSVVDIYVCSSPPVRCSAAHLERAQKIAPTRLCDNQGFPNELCGATQQSAMRAQFGRSGLLIAPRQIRLLAYLSCEAHYFK